jgi:hypothetical protein
MSLHMFSSYMEDGIQAVKGFVFWHVGKEHCGYESHSLAVSNFWVHRSITKKQPGQCFLSTSSIKNKHFMVRKGAVNISTNL